jgi:hypothetical protein
VEKTVLTKSVTTASIAVSDHAPNAENPKESLASAAMLFSIADPALPSLDPFRLRNPAAYLFGAASV